MRVEYAFEVDWADDGAYTGDDDITANVVFARWDRGRAYGSHIHGRSEPGTLTMTLQNPAGIYSPTNASSPLYGNLKQGRTVRVTAGEPGGADYVRFTGRIDKIIPKVGPLANRPECEISALGMLDDLAYVRPRSTVFEGLTTHDLAEVVLDYARKGYADFLQPDAPIAVFRMNVPEVALPTASPGSDWNFFGDAKLNFGGAIRTATPPIAGLSTEQEAEHRFGTARMTRLLGQADGSIGFLGAGVTDAGALQALFPTNHDPFSVELWAKLNDFPASPSYKVVLTTSGDFEIRINTSGGVRQLAAVRSITGTPKTVNVVSNTTVKLDTLQHIAVTYDGTNLTLYVDGSQVDTDTDSADNTNPDVRIGENGSGQAATLMAVGPVAFYNYELSAAQVAAHAAYVFDALEAAPALGDYSEIEAWWADGSKTALELLRDLENTEFGFLREKGDGSFVFEDKDWRVREARSVTSQATLSDAAAASISYDVGATLEDLKLQIVNIAEATAQVIDSNEENETILWELQPPMPTLAPGETKRFLANFAGDGYWRYRYTTDAGVVGPSPLTAVHFAVLPAANVSTLFVHNLTEVPITLTHLRFHGQTWTRHSPATMVEAKDASSTATYKSERKYSNTTPWLYGEVAAKSYCDFALYLLKDETPLLRLPVFANPSASVFHDLMELEISDRITAQATQLLTLWGLDEDFFVEHIAEVADIEGGTHYIELVCSAAAKYDNAWILGTGVLGTSTMLWY